MGNKTNYLPVAAVLRWLLFPRQECSETAALLVQKMLKITFPQVLLSLSTKAVPLMPNPEAEIHFQADGTDPSLLELHTSLHL